ncbi:hypothetical protein K7711_26950 [Nocardia sp. CA2R105]|uniref:hypothetical protein n=1 Tax=Nocardia coffeae TaxID=2873381 RepID=UPI001CA67B77|nr:hypothetical protein [Nocardia coffeae]MBY8860136.1 hypothetical protein [Nocardia coffeae]
MRTPKFAAITMLAIAATAITYSVAAADPASAAAPTTLISPVTASGTDHGVGFSMRRDGNAVALDVTGGTLRLDDRTVTIVAGDGSPVAALPLHLSMGDRTLDLGAHVDRTHLVAQVSAKDIGYWELTSPRQRSTSAGAALGALTGILGGIATGIFVAVVLGVLSGGVLVPIAFPIGVAAVVVGVIGGLIIGGISGASVPNSDVPDQWEYHKECHYIGNYDYEYCY